MRIRRRQERLRDIYSPALQCRTKSLTSPAFWRPPRRAMAVIAKRMSSPVKSETPNRYSSSGKGKYCDNSFKYVENIKLADDTDLALVVPQTRLHLLIPNQRASMQVVRKRQRLDVLLQARAHLRLVPPEDTSRELGPHTAEEGFDLSEARKAQGGDVREGVCVRR